MTLRLTIGIVVVFFVVCYWCFSATRSSVQASSADTDNQAIQKLMQSFALDLLPSDTRQIVLVQAIGEQHVGTLSAWERKGDRWVLAIPTIEVVLGAKGMVSPEEKKEGDKSTPTGIYRLSRAFGYLPFFTTKLSYIELTENHYWVDDPSAASYNQLVDKSPEVNSYETMKRSDDLYKLGIVIEYNTDPVVPGKGSAIFIHIWQGPGQPTAGCIAMSETDISQLLKWVDPDHGTVILLQKSFRIRKR